jgi:hypothetical protein
MDLTRRWLCKLKLMAIFLKYISFFNTEEKNLVLNFSEFTPAPWESDVNKAAVWTVTLIR